jgi:hypothetical protein
MGGNASNFEKTANISKNYNNYSDEPTKSAT